MNKKETTLKWFYENLKNYKSLDLNDKIIQELFAQGLENEKQYNQKLADDAFRLGWESHKTFTA
jgi:hypothetical protein